MTAQAKELSSVSIQQERTTPTAPAVKANQSTEGERPSDRLWLPIWALVLMYVVAIGGAIVIGIAYFGSH
jgi:hypothetical protein